MEKSPAAQKSATPWEAMLEVLEKREAEAKPVNFNNLITFRLLNLT